jgi:ankyrin repeat/IBR domain-containing protein 1
MIARPYLRTPKAVIVQTTALARRKRHEFVRAVAQGLIPPETPPTQRKRKRKYLDVSRELFLAIVLEYNYFRLI